MLHFGPLAFAQPWILTALLVLPLLWWLLRVTPPAPRTLRFPAIRLLFGLLPPEETPARTPWWLLLLRLIVALLIVLGVAQPLLNPAARLSGSGPLMLVIDDGWAAARHWQAREAAIDGLLAQAEREARPVVLLTTAPGELDEPTTVSGLLTAGEARRRVQGVTPKPWPVDRAAALAALEGLDLPGSANVVWLSDGLADGVVQALALRLQGLGELHVLRDGDGALPRLLLPPETDGMTLGLRLRRAGTIGEESAAVLAVAEDGNLVARTPLAFEGGESVAEAALDLPAELRNRIARLSIEGEEQAGAVLLLDERWRRRPVGLVATGPLEEAQPLLSELYYLQRALEPFTELRRGEIGELLRRKLAVLVLPDLGSLPETEVERLAAWVEAGGLLLRFAGPRLAEDGSDRLLPVRLRGGGRTLGGVMTWDNPARLAPFDPEGPFGGLAVPDDVLINRQVLAEPSLELGERTWARLGDGTPLITAEPRGEGWTVLLHTTANTDWASLALSGLFVELLRRVVAVSQGVEGEATESLALPPLETLDGFGRLGAPPPTALAADQAVLDEGRLGPRHPPGYYGSDSRKRAHNLVDAAPSLEVIDDLPAGVSLALYAGRGEADLKPWLLAMALLLGLIDLMIALVLRGLLVRTARVSAAVLALVLALPIDGSWAQSTAGSASDAFAMEATLQTRLAFVRTGVPGGRRRQPRRPVRADPRAAEANLGRGRRAARRRPEGRRAGLLPPALLAGDPGAKTAHRTCPAQGQPVPLAGRLDPVRPARAGHRGPVARPDEPRQRGAQAPHSRAGDTAAGARAAGSRTHQVVLSDAGLSRPFRRRHALDRRDRGAGQRRRGLGHDRLQRLGPRLGGQRARPADLRGGPRGRAAARAVLPLRRQPGHVRADRQLQGRPGARALHTGAPGPMTRLTSKRRGRP
jgi:hypothetical protein